MLKKETKNKIKRLIIILVAIIIPIFIIERIYNSRDEFQVTAEDASYYGILEAKLTTREKLHDFDYLYDTLEENYPFFKVNERLFGIDWLGNKKKYRRIVKNTKNDAEFFVAIDTMLKDLNNGHVNVFNGWSYRWFNKGYYEYYARYGDPKYLSMHEAMTNPYVMNRYKYNRDIEEEVVLYPEPVFETKVLTENELAYIKIKQMAGFDVAEGDHHKIRRFLETVENYEKIIIDIRGNGGGYDKYWENLVRLLTDETLKVEYYSFFKDGHRQNQDVFKVKGTTTIKDLDDEILESFPEEVKTDFSFYKSYRVIKKPSKLIDFKGKVYLLVDKGVFSSAEKFASFAKDSGFATLVGEATGGDRVFEEIPIIFLPKTKFVIRYSRELGMNADGTINMETKTTPHIEVDPTPHEDFRKDEAIQAVIKDKNY